MVIEVDIGVSIRIIFDPTNSNQAESYYYEFDMYNNMATEGKYVNFDDIQPLT